jgi:hypothetical protein
VSQKQFFLLFGCARSIDESGEFIVVSGGRLEGGV